MDGTALTCSNYVGGAFWCNTFDPGLSEEPPECGHSFDYDPIPEEWSDWTLCPKCGGEVYTR